MPDGDYAYDLAELEQIAASRPDSVKDIQILADAYADLARWDDAARTYRAAIRLDPAHADLYNSLATVCEELGDLDEAEKAYQKAIELRPDDSMPYYNLGLLYEEQERIPEAIQVYEKCLQYSTDPDERSTVRHKLTQMQPESEYETFDVWRVGLINKEKWTLRLGSYEARFICPATDQVVRVPKDRASKRIPFIAAKGQKSARIFMLPISGYNLMVKRGARSYLFKLEPDDLDTFRAWLPDAVAAKIPPVPVTGWRLALAAIYGLAAALALGYLWYLLATETEKRYGYAALVLGLVVGVVVSFMGGGNKDKRYSLLGAVLSGAGIAYGEFLIFGLSGSRFIYKFDFVDLFIYALAVYEGWAMPQRSVALVRRRSHLVNERNRKPILVVGVAALALLSGLTAQVKQDLPDLSEVVLTPQDFPPGFLEIHTEAFGLEAGQSAAGDYEIESAFAVMSFEPFETVWGITVLLPTRVDQNDFDVEMGQKDASLALLVEAMEAEAGDILEQAVLSDLEVIGDASLGLTIVADSEDMTMRLDVVVFRRDAVGAFVYVSYADGEAPVVPVDDAARKLDDRIIEALSADD
jgi:tetratricopeptide (TPR) repeat protein